MEGIIGVSVLDNDAWVRRTLPAYIESICRNAKVRWVSAVPDEAMARCMMPASRPEVLIVDMALGGVSGATVCRSIRRRTAAVGLVGITAYAVADFRREAIGAGMQALIGKDELERLACIVSLAAQGLPEPDTEFLTAEESHRRLQREARQPASVLSDQQRAVVTLLAQRLTPSKSRRDWESGATRCIRTWRGRRPNCMSPPTKRW